jgi:glyoxylase-like metal-dependent hydrolase (beta-lactamase superfamily II)
MKYSWRLLRGGTFKLDGGSMFGLVPRVVWSKNTPPDDRGRITVQHNCLLLESSTAGGPSKKILIEVGSGNKLDAKSRDIFGMEDRTIVDALGDYETKPEDISAVVVSHLHFDHAGGLTRLPVAGEQGGEFNAVPTFANAEVIVQEREWDDALANRSVMTRTYFKDHLEPIREQLRLVDSPQPFSADNGYGWAPDRGQNPGDVADRVTRVLPGIDVFRVPGHTWGQQAVMFTDNLNRTVVFTPDVMPTRAHLGAAYSLSYDVEPYTSMITKSWFLKEAAAHNWLLVLDHEPGNPVCRVQKTETGYELTHETP